MSRNEPKASITKRYTHFSSEEDEFIKNNFLTLSYRQIADHLGRSKYGVQGRMLRMGLSLPADVKYERRNYFNKGHAPANKGMKQYQYMTEEAIERTKATRFKKGEPNHNSLFDGAITLRHDHPNRPGSKPHYHLRLSKGIWKELQIYNWEKVHGPIPKDHILACKSGDTLDCDISNWYLLSRADNAKRNAGHKNLPDSYVAFCLAGRNKKHLKEVYLKYPHLIDLKRTQLKLKKAIKDEQRRNRAD